MEQDTKNQNGNQNWLKKAIVYAIRMQWIAVSLNIADFFPFYTMGLMSFWICIANLSNSWNIFFLSFHAIALQYKIPNYLVKS